MFKNSMFGASAAAWRSEPPLFRGPDDTMLAGSSTIRKKYFIKTVV
jgi:hypothetical protein